MEKQLLIIGTTLGKTFKTETFATEILALIGEKDATNKALTDRVAALEKDAADGKAFRKSLIEDYLKAGVLLEEVKSDEASQKSETDFLMTVPIERLKVMSSKAMAEARTKFPGKFEIPASDQTDRENQGKAAEEAAAASGSASAGKTSLSDMAKERAAAGKK